MPQPERPVTGQDAIYDVMMRPVRDTYDAELNDAVLAKLDTLSDLNKPLDAYHVVYLMRQMYLQARLDQINDFKATHG